MAETARAAKVRQIAENWPGITSINGQSSPRNIQGTGKRSEHTWGNALDIYGAKTALASLGTHLDSQRGAFAIGTLCYDGATGRKFDSCTTPHTDHLHVDFLPHCGGSVSDSGTGSERARSCDAHQQNQHPGQGGQGGNMIDQPTENGGGFLGIQGAIEDIATRGIFLFIGSLLAVAGVVFLVKDTDTFRAVQGAAMKVATKGAV